MENARLLDERLRRIIWEISEKTGGEIKKNLISEIKDCFSTIIEEQHRKDITDFLKLLKAAVDNMHFN